MGLNVSEYDGVCRVLLDGEITIYTVAELKSGLIPVLQAHDETEVDLGAVEEMDTAGLQLMLMVKRCEGKKVRFINHSPAVLRLLELANSGSQLGDPLLFSSHDPDLH